MCIFKYCETNIELFFYIFDYFCITIALTRLFGTKTPFEFVFSCCVIHKGYFAFEKRVCNVRIKVFWYTNTYYYYLKKLLNLINKTFTLQKISDLDLFTIAPLYSYRSSNFEIAIFVILNIFAFFSIGSWFLFSITYTVVALLFARVVAI